MTNQPAPEGPPGCLVYNGHPIHIIMHEGVPWFASDNLCAAMNRNHYALEYVEGNSFPDFARITAPEYDDDGREIGTLTFLSSVGVWYFAHHADPWEFQKLSAWAKKQALALCPDADQKDPRLFLTILPDGEMPPCPKRYSGRRAEWWALKDAQATAQADALNAELRERRDAREASDARALRTPIERKHVQPSTIQRPQRPVTPLPDFAAASAAARKFFP